MPLLWHITRMQKIMGKNLFEVADTDDKLFRKEIVEVAKKQGQWLGGLERSRIRNDRHRKTSESCQTVHIIGELKYLKSSRKRRL